jgi:carbon monoxide dehydrogenase subunit G
MDMTGEERIPAPRDTVWAALNDVDILKSCIPRCESLTWVSESELAALIKVKIGPISASFHVDIRLSNVEAKRSYTISAEGKGGFAGFARGAADVVLVDQGLETVLQYKAGAEIGGKLAQMGSRIIGSSAAKLAGKFFGDFNAAVSGGKAAPDEAGLLPGAAPSLD